MREKIREFHKYYHTIGNMVPLPDQGTIELIRFDRKQKKNVKKTETINNYRGMNNPGFGDYFDKFLAELECYFCEDEVKCDRNFLNLINKNKYYFDRFEKSRDGFWEFCRINFFMDYFTEDRSKVDTIFKHYGWLYKLADKEYKEAAKNYIDNASKIIENRADKILKKIQNKLSDN